MKRKFEINYLKYFGRQIILIIGKKAASSIERLK
jgi:hypothetical protein